MKTIGLCSAIILALFGFSCQSEPPKSVANQARVANQAPTSNTREISQTSTETTASRVDGCFVQIWEDENYEDSTDIIHGPGRWNNMRGLPGANKSDWGDQIDSLKVGPIATVKACEDEGFEDNCQTYGPRTEKTNLRGNPDMGDQIDSMEITCQ